MTSKEHQHQGSFADGQATSERHPEDAPHGDFAKGQGAGEHRHEGIFAGGQANDQHHPEDEPRGNFA
jgi:hypothetical protein